MSRVLVTTIGDALLTGAVGEVEDVAATYLFLLQQPFASGSTLTVDGGAALVRPLAVIMQTVPGACSGGQALTMAATGPPPDGPWCTAATDTNTAGSPVTDAATPPTVALICRCQ